ncbi:MAG TPA: hypothetical protein VN520_27020 [Streptomyces sp.]|uniref:hypothetical protein n=1 Tax=Streptomyces sp. TaxID=1931 RepID=UPI002BFC2FB4|nr:hypothetical protein [Streptomyces sp.]HWU09982.1 hypothetical protein [Streptomyces sp.]
MRDATARIVLSVLTAILFAVQFPAPSAPYASAHGLAIAHSSFPGSPQAHAAGLEGQVGTQTGREYASCGTPVHEGDPNGLLRTRDRHRTVVQATPEPLSRCLVTGDTAGRPPATAPAAPAGSHRTSRSSVSRSPAALQVFRC